MKNSTLHNAIVMGSIISCAVFVVLGLTAVDFIGNYKDVSAATSSATTVTASINTTISCSAGVGSTAFGTLTTGSIAIASPNVTTTMSCNDGLGCTLNVQDQGNGSTAGLWNSTASKLLASADATLAAGTEGYGIQATTTVNGTGGTLTVPAKYNKSGNNVGGLLYAGSILANSSAAIANREIVVTHKAAIDALTAAGSYTDTITYSCIAN